MNTRIDGDSPNCANMANLDNLLSVIPVCDGKKEHNIKLYLQQFQETADQTKLIDTIKLIIVKSKFMSSTRDYMQADTE